MPVKKVSAKGGSASGGKKTVKKAKPLRPAQGKPIGKVTHYYGGIEVAIVKFNKVVKKGTMARFSGATTNFEQSLDSMQYDHKDVSSAPKGKEVGIKVNDKVRDGDEVFEIK